MIPPISTGIRLAAAKATTPLCSAIPTSAPDDGVTAHSTRARPAVRRSPDAATATARTAAAAATSPVGLGASGAYCSAAGRSGASWRITWQLSHEDLSMPSRHAAGCPRDQSLLAVPAELGADDDLRSGHCLVRLRSRQRGQAPAPGSAWAPALELAATMAAGPPAGPDRAVDRAVAPVPGEGVSRRSGDPRGTGAAAAGPDTTRAEPPAARIGNDRPDPPRPGARLREVRAHHVSGDGDTAWMMPKITNRMAPRPLLT